MEELKFNAMIKTLEDSCKANWESNFSPRDFKDFETYREFFMQSYLLVYVNGAGIDLKDLNNNLLTTPHKSIAKTLLKETK